LHKAIGDVIKRSQKRPTNGFERRAVDFADNFGLLQPFKVTPRRSTDNASPSRPVGTVTGFISATISI
jgi:hypothetical protein